jgi:regulatory protein
LDEALKARALRLLARREHSRAELARKLAPHAESAEALAAVLDELLSRKQLSDERFAAERSRMLSRKYGAAKIRDDLRARGIAAEIVEAISTQGELERARAILARKYRAPAATPEERAKRARFLQGRGFSTEVILQLLRAAFEDHA